MLWINLLIKNPSVVLISNCDIDAFKHKKNTSLTNSYEKRALNLINSRLIWEHKIKEIGEVSLPIISLVCFRICILEKRSKYGQNRTKLSFSYQFHSMFLNIPLQSPRQRHIENSQRLLP